MKNYIILLLIVVFSAGLSAQRILSSQNVASDMVPSEKGPNKKKYSHYFISFGTFVGNVNTNAQVNPIKSMDFEFGKRTKRAFNRHLAYGFDLSLRSQNFGIVQDDDKDFLDNVKHKSESIVLTSANAGLYFRFSFGKVGNYIGKFMDVGIDATYPFSKRHITKDKMSDGTIVQMQTSRLTFIEAYQYGAYARIGFTKFSVWGKYRLSTLFTESMGNIDFTPISVGVQIGLH